MITNELQVMTSIPASRQPIRIDGIVSVWMCQNHATLPFESPIIRGPQLFSFSITSASFVQNDEWGGDGYLDTGLVLSVPGVLVNPMLLALMTWFVVIAPLIILYKTRRRYRKRKGLCPACAYPIGSSNRCSECGFELSL